MKIKSRLDSLLLQQHPSLSRNQIASFIMQGKVKVDGIVTTKAGAKIAPDTLITLELPEKGYVCRAGWKLQAALDYFNLDVSALKVLDAGLSTGGFTDCLLQRGASHVYGVDVGYGQVHEKIRSDPRVTIMERTNLRYLENLPEKVDLATIDLSFISVLKVMPALSHLIKPHGKLIVLIKPQFEATRAEVGKGGIIKDPAIHAKVVSAVIAGIVNYSFTCQGFIESPILGSSGNKEFLAYFIFDA